MRVVRFAPELQLTALQDAQRGTGMNGPPAPSFGNKSSSVCLCITPWGTGGGEALLRSWMMRLPRETVDAPPLEVFKNSFYEALSNWV